MKKCPYCAEEIQDDAIKCRYCLSDLTIPVPSPATASSTPDTSTPTEPTASAITAPTSSPSAAAESSPLPAGSVQYTHSGYRYVLGYGVDFFGIWDRETPPGPAERFPRTDEGWRQVWTRFAGLEPSHIPVPQAVGAVSAQATTATTVAPAASSIDVNDNEVTQYTHSGQRYLLGYGKTYFGIWDRQAPTAPVERFTRDDTGWQAAWGRFTTLESNYTEVGLGGAGTSSASGTTSPS